MKTSATHNKGAWALALIRNPAVIEALPDRGDAAALWCDVLIAMAAAAGETDHLRLTNEIVAEAGRAPRLMAILYNYDSVVASAIAEKLTRQQAEDVVRATNDPMTIAQSMLMLVEGLTTRNMILGAHFGPSHRVALKAMVAAALE